MMRGLLACLALIAIPAHADEVRVYQADAYGNIQYHKPSLAVRADGRVIQTDPYGNKLYHKQQYQITGDKVVPASALGSRQYSKPALVIKEN
jgi:hypothetical protein